MNTKQDGISGKDAAFKQVQLRCSQAINSETRVEASEPHVMELPASAGKTQHALKMLEGPLQKRIERQRMKTTSLNVTETRKKWENLYSNRLKDAAKLTIFPQPVNPPVHDEEHEPTVFTIWREAGSNAYVDYMLIDQKKAKDWKAGSDGFNYRLEISFCTGTTNDRSSRCYLGFKTVAQASRWMRLHAKVIVEWLHEHLLWHKEANDEADLYVAASVVRGGWLICCHSQGANLRYEGPGALVYEFKSLAEAQDDAQRRETLYREALLGQRTFGSETNRRFHSAK